MLGIYTDMDGKMRYEWKKDAISFDGKYSDYNKELNSKTTLKSKRKMPGPFYWNSISATKNVAQ